MQFSERLRDLIIERDITQSELALKVGIPKSSVSQYLSGKSRPRQSVLSAIAEVLEVTEEYLMSGADEREGINLPVAKAAQLMGMGQQYVRVGLQNGNLPFGYAVKMGGRYTYYISPKKFTEYTGIEV